VPASFFFNLVVFHCKQYPSENPVRFKAYSESQYHLQVFLLQRRGRDFANVRHFPSFTGKKQTPIRGKQIMFTYCSVHLKYSRCSSAPPTVKLVVLSIF
jgi:hypothetical protein